MARSTRSPVYNRIGMAVYIHVCLSKFLTLKLYIKVKFQIHEDNMKFSLKAYCFFSYIVCKEEEHRVKNEQCIYSNEQVV